MTQLTGRRYDTGEASRLKIADGRISHIEALGNETVDVVSLPWIAPGMIDTEGLKAHPKYDAVIERALKITPLKRVGVPEDVANLVHFLVSDYSSYITGEVIHITGGRY